MNKKNIVWKAFALLLITGLLLPRFVIAQTESQERIMKDSKEAKASFLKSDPSMESLFKTAAGYVIFPNVGKGAMGVGGAAGRGTVYHNGMAIGTAHMDQLTIGAQVGGQTYREIIFFENKDALNRFRHNKVEFNGQVSAIAVKSGASANANYRNSVVVFSQEKTGLMLEAALGGQKLNYTTLK
jgi:lipid-binding SYLF domain-containing protein